MSLRDMGEHHPPGFFERRPGEPAPPDPPTPAVVAAGVLWLLSGVLVFVVAQDRDITVIALGLSLWGFAVALMVGHRAWWLVRLRRGAITAATLEAAAAAEAARAARRLEDVRVRRQVTTFLGVGGGFVAGLALGALAFRDDPGGRVWLCGLVGSYVGAFGLRLARRRSADAGPSSDA